MEYILDTCVISDFIKGDKSTQKKLLDTNPNQISISTISLMEINYGLANNPEKAKKIKPVLQQLIESINILPYSEEDAEHTAIIRSNLCKKGTPISSYDILIAGTALSHDATLVSANEKEFTRIKNLKFENWRFSEFN